MPHSGLLGTLSPSLQDHPLLEQFLIIGLPHNYYVESMSCSVCSRPYLFRSCAAHRLGCRYHCHCRSRCHCCRWRWWTRLSPNAVVERYCLALALVLGLSLVSASALRASSASCASRMLSTQRTHPSGLSFHCTSFFGFVHIDQNFNLVRRCRTQVIIV